jgi:4-amino-4-deoxy-L-arabinose transferase-like glycosyltransferase
LIVLVVYQKEILKHTKELIFTILLFILFLVPLAPFVLSGEAGARYKLVSITNEEGLVPRINERRGLSTLPKPLPRLIHNKVTYISYYFAKNYLAHFTPDFLFISGVSHRQHHVQGMGELYKIQALFLLAGLYLLFKRKEKFRWFLIVWLLLAFVPVATTKDSIPNALRTLIAAPFYQIVTAYGFWEVLKKIKNRNGKLFLLVFSALILLVELSLYLRNYYQNYAKNYSRDWQYGYQQAVGYISEHYKQYDRIVFSRYYGEPHMFTLFYLNYPPRNYQNNENLVRYKAYDWVWVISFDKFYFPNLSDVGTGYLDIIKENPGKKILFIGRKEDFPDGVTRLKTIDFLDGNRAFDIVEAL